MTKKIYSQSHTVPELVRKKERDTIIIEISDLYNEVYREILDELNLVLNVDNGYKEIGHDISADYSLFSTLYQQIVLGSKASLVAELFEYHLRLNDIVFKEIES